MKKNLAILITCHNRLEKTKECLKSIYFQKKIEQYDIKVFLVDDGSTDGTSEYIKENFPEIILIQGDGNLYWGGGMYLAWEEALNYKKNFDYFLWVNDDVIFFNDAFQTLLETKKNDDDIIVGGFCDRLTRKRTYGGTVSEKKFLSPFRFKIIDVNGSAQEIDGINGNGVLITFSAFKKIGKFDKKFIHAGGDLDYSLRAKKKNIKVYLTPKYIGFCERSNFGENIENIKDIFNKKSFYPKVWLHFCVKHGGFFWYFHFLFRFLRIFLKILINKIKL